jgi:putative membrane-bound dehydrogenase-like protein
VTLTFTALLTFAAQDLSPDESVRRMKVSDGFEVTVVASEPQVRQPVTMTFDERGRIWVIQYLQYPTPAGLKPVSVDQYLRTKWDRVPEPPPKGPKGADRVTILEDKDGDGRYETAKDFVAGLNLATGLCLGHGGVYVAQPPYLLYYADRNRDDVPDGDPEVLLSGFGMEDSHAFVNSLQWGPDGWLYGTHGSTVTANVRGIEFQQGIWRFHPRTKDFELYSEGGGNTWGLDFDRHGHVIAGTNFGGFANLHQMQGAYHVKGFGKHGPLHNPYTFGYFDHIPYKDFRGGHVTCGGIVYQGGAIPSLENAYVAANPLSNAIHWHLLEPDGSTFRARFGGELLTTPDPWFRPIDCLAGPDGAIYVVDWYDARLNHVDPRDNWDRRNGRIYRIAPKGLPRTGGPQNAWHRREALRVLAEKRDPSVSMPPDSLQALWSLHASGAFDDEVARKALLRNEPMIRAWTVRLLGDPKQVSPAMAPRLVELARSDPAPEVRAQLACTAKRLSAAQGLPIVRELLRRAEDAKDPFIPLLVWWAIEDKAVSDRESVLSLLSGPESWRTPLMESHVIERLARRYIAQGGDENYATAAKLLVGAPSDTELLKVVSGMEAALDGRRLDRVPVPLERALGDLWKNRGENLKVLRLAIRLGSPDAFRAALSRPPTAELVEVLGQTGSPEALPCLLKALESANEPLVQASVAALAPFPEAAPALAARLPALRGAARTRALAILLGRAGSAALLLDLVDAGKVAPKDVPLDPLVQLMPNADEALKKRVEKHWGRLGAATPGEKRAQIASVRNILSKGRGTGDAARGKAIFTRNCAACHVLHGEGGKIGPELTGQDRKNLELLVTHIVDPSAMVRPEFGAWKLRTKDESVITGLLVEQSADAVTIVDAQNNRTTVARSRIEALVASELSLMPEKLLDPLSDPEVCDFFAYLQSDKPVEAGPLRVCLVSGSLEYESDASLAAFQDWAEKTWNVKCFRAFRKTDEDLPGLDQLASCDVLLLFTRRLKPPPDQLEHVKRFIAAGKPVVGVRTASHAFQNWLELDKLVFGGSYTGHFGKGPACEVRFTDKAKAHPILDGVKEFVSAASLYKNASNSPDTETLLLGTAGGKTEPVAWTRSQNGGRVFYTSLGDQGDFRNDDFRRVLLNALFWTGRRTPDRRQAQALPGTKPLEMQGDLAAQMVEGIGRFLLRQIDESVERRKQYWKRDVSSREAYDRSVAPNRERFRQSIGVVDARIPFESPELVSTVNRTSLIDKTDAVEVHAIRWPVLRGIQGEGLLFIPTQGKPGGNVVLLDDPGLKGGQGVGSALRLAAGGARVVVPVLIDRADTHSVSGIGRATNQPHREFVYRPAFEMGRHVIGYEVQKILALVDWFHKEAGDPSVGVVGLAGDASLLALYAGAADPRIDGVVVGGYFESRQKAWQEPIYRNVWRLLEEFGDAEIASLVTPRVFRFEKASDLSIDGPPVARAGRSGAAPGVWRNPPADDSARELLRLDALVKGLELRPFPDAFPSAPKETAAALNPEPLLPDAIERQLQQLLEDTQVLLRRSEKVRDEFFWKKISKKSLKEFEESTLPFREIFDRDVMGRFELPFLPPNARSRVVYDEPKYVGYEVVLDVWQDVYAYGILLLPKDLKPGERRPVVVTQHGLEGRPQDVADPGKSNPAYEQYACRLAERGFVVFAPQNPYIGRDLFRTLQRKANLLGRHLFSIIIPQHRVITDWLAAQPFVDPDRIAFYGLSYGGKTAMRVPAVLPRYCLSICSADFNEWIWKNASLDNGYTYVTTGEYEIFEWNLGNTFNYAEMAALIAPRPFMVERGHFDGVAPDEKVYYEYAKVKRLYDELKIGDRCEMEVFTGPHKINGVGTFDFLHKHLRWPKP